jgi:hypothetical protein
MRTGPGWGTAPRNAAAGQGHPPQCPGTGWNTGAPENLRRSAKPASCRAKSGRFAAVRMALHKVCFDPVPATLLQKGNPTRSVLHG